MKNYKIKILFIFLLTVFLNLVFSNSVSAVTVALQTEKETVAKEEQFLVDVYLTPGKNEDANAFDFSVSYSPNLSFLGSKNGSSITGLWIEKPKARFGVVDFSGIMPGGFKGVVDPMNPNPINNQKSGLITRLIFVGKNAGQAYLSFEQQIVLANDGLGSILETSSSDLLIKIDEKIYSSVIDEKDNIPPEHFLITLSRDPLLFDGKYVISFETKDKESGINYYEVKEEGKDWQKGESPYVTQNQPPFGTIYVKAVDHNGNSTTEELTPNIPQKQISKYSILLKITIILLFIIIFILMIFFLIKRKRSNLTI